MFGLFGPKIENISPLEAKQKLDTGSMLIDVRESNEWKSGHAPGAKHIALGALENKIKTIPKELQIMVICQSGVRSKQAAKMLAAQGFQVVNVSGGMSNWNRMNLRTVK